MRILVGAFCLAASLSAHAETVTLRIATVAPDGTSWAREMHAMARHVAEATRNELLVKYYFGGIAGDDKQAGDRVKTHQLDGVASGGMLCQELAPSLRVLRIPGLVQTQEQARYLLTRLKPKLDDELRAHGYMNLAEIVLGPSVLFSRQPIRSMSDLRRARLWRWDLDTTANRLLTAMGLHIVPSSLSAAAKAYDDGVIDGFSALPAAALAFQWSTQARYITNLPTDYLVGCVIVSTAAFDALPIEHRRALADATAAMAQRAEDVERRMSEALIGSLFRRQGLITIQPSTGFVDEFFAATREARSRAASAFVPLDALSATLEMIADYFTERNAHGR